MNNICEQKHITATVKNIKWERINLYIDVEVSYNDAEYNGKPLDFYLVNNAGKQSFFVTPTNNFQYYLKSVLLYLLAGHLN